MIRNNKKGFIAISIIFSFFIVFLMLLTINITNYVQNEILMNQVKKDIKNSTAISIKKYTSVDISCIIQQSENQLIIYPENVNESTYSYSWDNENFSENNRTTITADKTDYIAYIKKDGKVAYCTFQTN